ncbi:MAG: ribosome silencing factor [Lachnospiraceae bacterium]|nr:ribosome silencing factor [Lachnospiraceae bacterium]
MKKEDSLELVALIKAALEDKKIEDIKVLDISGVSIMADYFIIGSGSNRNQIQAAIDNVDEKTHEINVYAKQIEGYDTANWVLVDFGDVILHVFDNENRLFYDLERIWADGKEVAL